MRRLTGFVPALGQLLYIALVWLGILPLLVSIIHSLAFCRGLRDAWFMLKHLNWSPRAVALSWLCGMSVSFVVILGGGLLTLLQDVGERIYRRFFNGERPAFVIDNNPVLGPQPAFGAAAPPALGQDAPVQLQAPMLDDEVSCLPIAVLLYRGVPKFWTH